ncbi:hypothetical protein UlMin_012059 [Ulmus minor]
MFHSPKRQRQALQRKIFAEYSNKGADYACNSSNYLSIHDFVLVAYIFGKTMTATEKPLRKQRRVVVTGLGVISLVGHKPNIYYNNLLEGISGISEIVGFDCAQFRMRIAGEIKSLSIDGLVESKISKRAEKFMLFMITAGKKALKDGGMTEEVIAKRDKFRCGVIIGSALGGFRIATNVWEALRVSYKKMNPYIVPFVTTNMGPNYSIYKTCSTINFCILNAANHIMRGDTNCDGIVMGEGAGVLLLEELEHAKEMCQYIYAKFLGGIYTCDVHHFMSPHPDGRGFELCIEKALSECRIAREDINYINSHASSTPIGDLSEYQAITNCFGKNPKLKVNSTKSIIGNLVRGSGATVAIAVVKTGWVHPTLNLEDPDEGLLVCVDHDINVMVGPKKERLDMKVALSILFAPYK